MAILSDVYNNIADVNLWLKINDGDDLVLADIPSLIPLRWTYLKDNWEFIKPALINTIASYSDPDFFNQQIADFSVFIEAQRNGSQKVNPLQDGSIFHKYYAIFDNLKIDDINLTNEETRIISNEIDRVKAFSKNNFLAAKKQITDYRDRTTDVYGLGDDDYNTTVNRSGVSAQITATVVEVNYLLSLQNILKTIDFILANLFAVDQAIDPFALARANANNPDINIGQYSSGRLVSLNFGESFDDLSNRFFGSPDQWIDIAIANGLKPPYIDEIGQQIPLLSNGAGNQVNLAGTDINGGLNIDKLYINQPIFLQSNIEVIADQRSIIAIKEVPISGEIILELDGEYDMSRYKTVDNANIRVFAPNTINSNFLILIPSTSPLPNDRKEETPWFLTKSSEDEKRAKVDLSINDAGDISFGPNGDFKLSYGLDNAMQAIKLKIVTEFGSLRYHPKFGLVNVLGNKNSDVGGLKDMLTQSITNQVSDDSRFDRIETLSVDYLVDGASNTSVGAFIILMTVRLAGGSQVIPISFTIQI
jgi:hypothetical protein